MGAERALLATLITSITRLCGMCIQKVRCAYRHTNDSCEPACACVDGKLEKDNDELEVHTVQANSIDLIYVARKRD